MYSSLSRMILRARVVLTDKMKTNNKAIIITFRSEISKLVV